jgi:hypothetical protein
MGATASRTTKAASKAMTTTIKARITTRPCHTIFA